MIAVQLDQAGPPAGRGRGGHVALAVGVGHAVVAARVQAEHRDGQRHRGDRIGETVLRGQFVRAAAHQVERRRVADPLPRAVGEREHARLGDYSGQRDISGPARAGGTGRELPPARRPGRQVPAGAVPDSDHPPGVHRQRPEQVDARRDVLERPRPAPARFCPAVLQVPRRVAARRQVGRERPPKRQVIPRPPEPPVDHHHGPACVPFGQPQLAELTRIRPVPVDGWLSHELRPGCADRRAGW